jgi:epsilon-lactone hydrolase
MSVVKRWISTGTNHDHDTFFRSLIENPPLPPSAPLEIRRGVVDSLGSLNPPIPDDVRSQHVSEKCWTAKMLIPANADPNRLILYVHGGSFTMGSIPGIWEYPVYRIARAGDAAALILNYRLAPESPFPAARDDVVSAYEYLLSLGHRPQNIVFAGDSAGAGLVLQALLAVRSQMKSMPAGVVVIGAWIDVANEGLSRISNHNDPLAAAEALAVNAALYLGNTDPRSPEANPLYANLSGLPRVRIIVGTRESLLDDSIRFSEAACKAGVDVEVELWADLNHGWYLFANSIVEAEATYNRMGYLIRELTPAM